MRKCKFCGTVSHIGAYAVYDENDNLIGYSDTESQIDYDLKGAQHKTPEKVEMFEINTSAWN